MIISHDSEGKMSSTCSISHVHTPAQNVSIYGGRAYVLDWHAGQRLPVNVKQEETEDAVYNNDSGVSPSHFSDHSNHNDTSPLSYRSEGQQSSLDSGNPDKTFRPSPSLSPEPKDDSVQTNATIGILATPILAPQQSASPELSHSPAEKQPDDNSRSSTSDAEGGVYEDDPLRRLQMALQKTGIMGPMSQAESPNGEKPLQCPLCDYSTILRSDFNNHLTTHSNQVSCSQCEYTAENSDKLREHLQDVHNTTMEDEALRWADEEEPGVTTPKINSQGKVKTYRCKQCDYTAVTKLDFWDHSRQHIKTERLLTCPKCPFVTEYKHHLEYHLRNHFGSKPFKCDKCPYTCVNKSMLNSHLKSHSTVYQFRCANCTYATKYCHSLKLHLRKYNHTPAMVLNPDGTPNPLPIVDIYGTRRGPKTKNGKSEGSVSPPPPSQVQQPAAPPVFPSPFAFMPSPGIPYPIGAMMSAFPSVSPIHYSNRSPPSSDEHLTNMDIDHAVFSMNNNKESVKEYFARIMTMQQELLARSQQNIEEMTRAPLDLSRSEQQVTEPAEQQTSTKSRRKGKAFKLERITQHLHQLADEDAVEQTPKRLKLESEAEQNHVLTEQDQCPPDVRKSPSPEAFTARIQSPPRSVTSPLPKAPDTPVRSASLPETQSPSATHSDNPNSPKVNFCEGKKEFTSSISSERKDRWKNIKEIYDCPYCDLLFGDVVMHTMHMGCHGYQNPFTCNLCGEETSDRVQFLLHLFRFKHG